MDFLSKFENTQPTMATATYSQIPEGQYVAQITDIEIKDEVFPESRSISVEFTIDQGDHKGRKTWWNTKLSETTSEKAFAFIKGTICKMAGVESTNGDTFAVLDNCRGNLVEIDLTYKPGVKNPEKLYAQVYINKMIKSN